MTRCLRSGNKSGITVRINRELLEEVRYGSKERFVGGTTFILCLSYVTESWGVREARKRQLIVLDQMFEMNCRSDAEG